MSDESAQDESGLDRCAICGTGSDETNLGWSEQREELVCVGCVIYLEDNGRYPDEDGPDRELTATYEVGA